MCWPHAQKKTKEQKEKKIQLPPHISEINQRERESSGTKIQPKKEVLGRTSLRTSRQKLRSGPQNPGKTTFRNGHPTRTSMKKFRSEKLQADFSFPKSETTRWIKVVPREQQPQQNRVTKSSPLNRGLFEPNAARYHRTTTLAIVITQRTKN